MRVEQIYAELAERAFGKRPRLVRDKRAGDSGRHYGYYNAIRDEIGYSPDLEHAPVTVIRGILAHEIGHALVKRWGVPIPRSKDASERQADRAAEQVLGLRIYYGARDLVQRAGRGARGLRPRPRGLR